MTAPETVVRYYNFDIVFAEIPGETTLAINIANCPNRCPGCHSPHLQADAGHVLDAPELRAPAGAIRTVGDLRLLYGRGCRAAPDRPAGGGRAAGVAGPARRLVFGTAGVAGRIRAAGVRLHQTGRVGRVAGAADFTDDQSAALQNRSCGRNGRHYGAIPSQAVKGTRFVQGSRSTGD